MINIITIAKDGHNPELIAKLLPVWERSVRATHTFLSNEEILQIKNYVPMAFSSIEHLLVAQDENSQPVGFMGINKHNLEMFFLDPEHHGHGLGRQLLEYGIEHYDVQTLAVNEQNPQAHGFYEHMGFKVFKRTELDEQGQPYPLLYMRREA